MPTDSTAPEHSSPSPSSPGSLRVVAEKLTSTVQLADRVLMHVRTVRPPVTANAVPRSRRVLIVCHGGMEHGLYYERFARNAAAHGWEVVIPDQRGHGLTAGPRVHVSQFDQYLADLDQVVSSVGSVPAQTALFGHSMGGLIAARYTQIYGSRIGALVLSAPLFKPSLAINPYVLMFGRILACALPTTKFGTGIPPGDLSRNPDYLARRAVDPLVEHAVTAAWYVACEQAMHEVATTPPFPGPTLMLQGTGDQIVCPRTNIDWAQRTGAELYELPDHKHALLQEPESELTQSRILEWLDRQFGDQAS